MTKTKEDLVIISPPIGIKHKGQYLTLEQDMGCFLELYCSICHASVGTYGALAVIK